MADQISHNDLEFYERLLVRKLTGEANDEDVRMLTEWIQQHADNKKYAELMEQKWNEAGAVSVPSFDTQAAWMKVKAQTVAVPVARVVHVNWYKRMYVVAASIALLVAAGIALFMFGPSTAEEVSYTAFLEKQLIYLPDSSKVWLNKQSTLTYLSDYGNEVREVTLQGEAFFEVQKNPKKPFTVHGTRMNTTVLGTSFMVQNIAGKPEKVQVSTGKVAFASAQNPENRVVLTPGLEAIEQSNAKPIVGKISDKNYLAWKEDKLHFDNQPISEVVYQVSKLYGKQITIADSALTKCRFTGTFEKMTLDEVLNVVAISTNASAKKVKDSYVLRGEGCDTP